MAKTQGAIDKLPDWTKKFMNDAKVSVQIGGTTNKDAGQSLMFKKLIKIGDPKKNKTGFPPDYVLNHEIGHQFDLWASNEARNGKAWAKDLVPSLHSAFEKDAALRDKSVASPYANDYENESEAFASAFGNILHSEEAKADYKKHFPNVTDVAEKIIHAYQNK